MKRVLTTGCFDPLHVGHVAQLKIARELGDYLIVALTTDEAVRREKGGLKPYFPYEERAMMLKELRCVSQVIENHGNSKDLLHQVAPDIYVKGAEYKGKLAEERYCKSRGIKVYFVDSKPVYSSTKLISGEWLLERTRSRTA